MSRLFPSTIKARFQSRGAQARFFTSFLLSGIFLYLACRQVDFSTVMATLLAVKISYLLPLCLLLFLTFFLRALRWRFLISPVKPIALHSLFSATMVGFMANNLLPLRAGEFVRAYSLARTEQIAVGASLATVVLDRLLDGLILSLCLVLLLFSLPFPAWLIHLNYCLLALYIGGLGGLAILTAKGGWHLLPTRLAGTVHNFVSGLASLRNRSHILWIFLLSFALWLVSALFYFLLFAACQLSLPFFAALVVLVVVAVGVSLPAAPGQVGSFHYFTVLALSFFAVPKEEALGFSLIAHALQFVPVTIVGLIYASREGLVRREERREFI